MTKAWRAFAAKHGISRWTELQRQPAMMAKWRRFKARNTDDTKGVTTSDDDQKGDTRHE